jgi:hypothetical protein
MDKNQTDLLAATLSIFCKKTYIILLPHASPLHSRFHPPITAPAYRTPDWRYRQPGVDGFNIRDHFNKIIFLTNTRSSHRRRKR